MRHAFVLGCERSGSTWLANILDAHPEVELLMEPFAGYAGLFPDGPERMGGSGDPDPGRLRALRRGLDGLSGHKHPLLYRPGRPTVLEAVDRRIAREVARVARRLRGPAPRWVQRYELLNLNASEVPAHLRARKARRPSLRVVKELRLNLAVRLVLAAFEDARVVVVVRNPVAQVASMLRWIERGRLRELTGSLPALRRALEEPGPLCAYGRLPKNPDDPVELLAVYWVASYGALLDALRRSGGRHQVLRHEDLCSDPEGGTAELLRFCGLPEAPQVERYLAFSSRAREEGPPRPLDTTRDSRRYAARALAAVPPDVRERVTRVLEDAAAGQLLARELAPYLDGMHEAAGAPCGPPTPAREPS